LKRAIQLGRKLRVIFRTSANMRLRGLDSGIIRIGAKIGHNDILVGKVTLRAETQLTPEAARSSVKAGDVRDASLTCPPGIEVTVVDVRIFSARDRRRTR